MNHNHHEVLIGEYEGGFIAASVAGPYFCFEAATEEEVRLKVQSALTFYYAHKQSGAMQTAALSPARTIRNFTPSKRLPVTDFIAA